MATGILSLLKGKNETENKLGNTLSLAWSFPHPFVGKAALECTTYGYAT